MNEEILEEILENTKAVKSVVVEKEEKLKKAKEEKAEKAKSAKQRAESKFTKIGTKLNEAELAKFQAKLETVGKNQSQYIKELINFDLIANEELIKNQNKSIENYIDTEKKNEMIVDNLKEEIKTLQDTTSSLNEKLNEELNKTFWGKVRALF